jgi:hypothetical protein
MKPLVLISLCCIGILNMQGQTALSWVHRLGNNDDTRINDIAVDQLGNVYAIGSFLGTVDFNPGSGITNLTSSGDIDIFITKSDAAGNFVWAKHIGGANEDVANAIALDPLGNIYIVGRFDGTADFDPNAGTTNMLAIGSGDAFVCKLDENGILMWAAKMGGIGLDEAKSVSADSNGDVIIGGYFHLAANFNPGPGVYTLTAAGGSDAFVAKLDAGGIFIWAERFGGQTDDEMLDLAIDADDHVMTTGYFTGTVDFDPGAGTSNLIATGAEDAFVLKLDVSGNFVWAKKFGGSGSEEGLGIYADDTGNIYTAGYFHTTVDFDPGPNTDNLTSAGQEDIFISKLNSNGDYIWAKRCGSADVDKAFDVRTDVSGNVYCTGYFGGTVDFDPNTGTATLTSNGVANTFISKFSPAGDFIAVSQLSCNNESKPVALVLDSEFHIYCAGYFNGTGDFDPGFNQFNLTSTGNEDAFIVKLNPCNATSAILTAASCGSYLSPDGQYEWMESGTYLDTIGNSGGCDSIITINLTILHQSEAEITVSTCNSFVAPGGDILSASGIYTDTIPNAAGCDSVIVINLTITPLDTTVIFMENLSLTAQMSGAVYQWIDCDNENLPIPEATEQSFSPVASGNYAVIISVNDCTDTSSCHHIDIVSTKDLSFSDGLMIFPNPARGYFNVKMTDAFKDGLLSIYDAQGHQVYQVPFPREKEMQIKLDLVPGVYCFTLKDSKKYAVRKLLVE